MRRAAVAGSWYPGNAALLRRTVEEYLAVAAGSTASHVVGDVRAVLAPHAGLMYSGPVGAFAYATLAGRHYDLVVLVGPSHFVAFDGVAIVRRGEFETPLGPLPIAEAEADALAAATAVVRDLAAAHTREHSLELQLPFLAYLLPGVSIIPLVMGQQRRETMVELGRALAVTLAGRNALLVASSDLSHYHAADQAARLDARVLECVSQYDADGLLDALEQFPDHACGGGPIVSVMLAARSLGARDARVLRYADSGDVSGDKTAVVGYMAAVLGNFGQGTPGG
jgi:MEMO1 family protein